MWQNDSSWFQLHSVDAEDLATGDIDGNGRPDVIIDFGVYGLWAWMNSSFWKQLHTMNPEGIAVGNFDGV